MTSAPIEPVDPQAGRVGVLIVGGFLGAGKSTLLRRLIADPVIGGRLAVLVNELGTLGIDGALIRGARQDGAVRAVQLDSGCLCCTLQGELGAALLELARPAVGPPPAQIIVELSGAALASEVHFQIATQALEAPYYADGLVCVVDAKLAPRWATEAEPLFRDQLCRADLVLLSKLDLASPAERASTEALIAELAPGARVVDCTNGQIDPALLLGIHAAPPPSHTHPVTHALCSETVELAAPLRRDALESILESITPLLYRVKGLVDVVDADGRRSVWVQCVGDQIELTPAPAGIEPRRLIFIGAARGIGRSPLLDRARLEAQLRDARAC